MTSFPASKPDPLNRLATAEKKSARRADARRTSEAERYYLIVSVILAVTMSAISIWIAPPEHDIVDYWEHLSSIKQLIANPLHPLHPQYATHDASRQYMPWFVALALLGRLLHWSPFAVLTFGAIVTTILSLIGIRLFFREYFSNSWAPLAGLITLLFIWGRPWVWSSFYSLRSLLMTAAYPSTFVFAITFFIWWIGLRALRSRSLRVRDLAAISVLLALAFLVHQLSGLFAAAGLACFVVAERPGIWPRKLILLGTIVAAGATIRFWPYFNPWQMANENQLWNPQWTSIPAERFYRLHDVLLCLGPAVLGIIPLAWFAIKRTYLGTVVAFAGAAAGYGIGGLLQNPISHRLLIVVILYLQIAITWALLVVFGAVDVPEWKFVRKWRKPLRRAGGGAVAILVVAQVGVVAAEMVNLTIPNSPFAHLPIRRGIDIRHPLEKLSAYLAPDSMVIATHEASMLLPAFKGRVVSVYRASPLVADDSGRLRDSVRFFSPTTSPEERQAIIARYRITHIFYWIPELPGAKPPGFLGDIAQQTHRAGDFALVEIRQPGP